MRKHKKCIDKLLLHAYSPTPLDPTIYSPPGTHTLTQIQTLTHDGSAEKKKAGEGKKESAGKAGVTSNVNVKIEGKTKGKAADGKPDGSHTLHMNMQVPVFGASVSSTSSLEAVGTVGKDVLQTQHTLH